MFSESLEISSPETMITSKILITLLLASLSMTLNLGLVFKGMITGRSHKGSQLRALPADEQYFVDLFNEAKGNVAYISSLDLD